MNKVILIGRLTKDPEIRYTQSAEPTAIAKYTLAVDRRFKRDGEPDADFIWCKSFGKQAEFSEKYLKKGMKIALTGRLTVYSYEDQAGQRRWMTEVVTEDVEFAESRSTYENRMAQEGPDAGNYGAPDRGYPDQGYASKPAPASKPAAYEPEGFSAITDSIDDDDLPF